MTFVRNILHTSSESTCKPSKKEAEFSSYNSKPNGKYKNSVSALRREKMVTSKKG
jgi:hypothetical protein